jgi:hypothetical protein
MVLEEFTKCATKAKIRMLAGGEIECIIDAWIKIMIVSEEYRKKDGTGGLQEEKPDILIRWFSDIEISMTVFTFLFASQDASSSACTWLFQLMADRPGVLDKVREENLKIRSGDRDKPLTMDMMDEMIYTRAVVKETLRYRPPVLMVPYVVKKDFPVTENYTIPKGTYPLDLQIIPRLGNWNLTVPYLLIQAPWLSQPLTLLCMIQRRTLILKRMIRIDGLLEMPNSRVKTGLFSELVRITASVRLMPLSISWLWSERLV